MAVPDPNVTGAWREGDRLFGHTILNDRGCMAVFMIAGRALAEHAGPLPGRVVFTSVAGETGQAPVDEYQGLRYEGKGFGSSYLVQHGVVGDFALVAETTDFASCWYNCGAAYFKVTRARVEHVHAAARAARRPRRPSQCHRQGGSGRPGHRSVGVDREECTSPADAVRRGAPEGPGRGDPRRHTVAAQPFFAVLRPLRRCAAVAGRAGGTGHREPAWRHCGGGNRRRSRPRDGQSRSRADGIEPLAEAVAASYRAVRGEQQPPEAEVAVVSMWRDTNVFNRAGIPALTFGPPRGRADVQGRGHFELDDLVDTAKMYALIALQILGGVEP